MRLERIKCKPLERAQSIYMSESYIVACTGQRAVILNKDLELLHTVSGLEYVYSAQLSPDESKLLLISNENKFYVVDMNSFEKIRVTVKYPYNRNLQGQGCWSFDGKDIWIPVHCKRGNFNSSLRRYSAEDLNNFEDFLVERYLLTRILRLEEAGAYFLTGYRYDNYRNYFLLFDGKDLKEYPLDNSIRLAAASISVEEETGTVTIASPGGCIEVTMDGTVVKEIEHPQPANKTLDFADVFTHFLENKEKKTELKELSAAHGMNKIPAPDYINKLEVSDCGKYVYLASQSGFYLIDANGTDVLASVPVEFGVQDIRQIAPDVIALATWHGVWLYRIVAE